MIAHLTGHQIIKRGIARWVFRDPYHPRMPGSQMLTSRRDFPITLKTTAYGKKVLLLPSP
jgi:hypothetical protein